MIGYVSGALPLARAANSPIHMQMNCYKYSLHAALSPCLKLYNKYPSTSFVGSWDRKPSVPLTSCCNGFVDYLQFLAVPGLNLNNMAPIRNNKNGMDRDDEHCSIKVDRKVRPHLCACLQHLYLNCSEVSNEL